MCDWLQSCGDFTFWSFTFEHEYARHKVVFVVDEVRRRTRSACITATPADVMPELVDYDSDTSSISSSSSGSESSDMPDLEKCPVAEPTRNLTSTDRQEVIVAGSVVDDGSQPHGQNGCQQANGLVAVVEAAIMAEVVQEYISDQSHAVMAHMQWVLVQSWLSNTWNLLLEVT